MVGEASRSASMLKTGLSCDVKTSGKQPIRSTDAIKNCIKLVAVIAILVLILECFTQQLQASKLPLESSSDRARNACCLDIIGDGSNGTLIVDSIDRHDRGINDKPFNDEYASTGRERSQVNGQNETSTEVSSSNERLDSSTQPEISASHAAVESPPITTEDAGDKNLLPETTTASTSESDSDLATMASSGILLLPSSSPNRMTLNQLAAYHETLETGSVQLPTVQHPISLLAPIPVAAADRRAAATTTIDSPLTGETQQQASIDEPSLEELTVAGTTAGMMAHDQLVAAQANNYGREHQRDAPSSEDGDDDSSNTPNIPGGTGQLYPNESDEDEQSNSNNADDSHQDRMLRQHRMSSMMQPINGAPMNVYQDSTPRQLDIERSSGLAQEQSNGSPRESDESAMVNEQQMPDSIESLMRSGGETGPIETEGSDEQSTADEPENAPNQAQQLAAGNNYIQNADISGVSPQDMYLAGNPNAYPPIVDVANSNGQLVNSQNGKDDDQSDDDDDEDSKGVSSSTAYNQQMPFPAHLSQSGQQLVPESTHNGPILHDTLQTAAGHHYKKKKKVKKVKKIKVVKIKKKKKKKKKYKVIKYKKKKKKKAPMDHGKYYMYAKVPKKKSWEFGFKKGNKKHWIERHEKGHKNKFKTKVKWYDKKSKGKGIHIWDYNHHDKKKKKHYG